MAKIVSVYSFRRGTGRSTITANMAVLLASTGYRVAVLDCDIASPSLHGLFGLTVTPTSLALNDYLRGTIALQDAAVDVSAQMPVLAASPGRLFVVPASSREIVHPGHQGYDVATLNEGMMQLSRALRLDVVLLDTGAGLNEETLRLIAICDGVAMLLRLDQQDYQGTAVILDIARSLGIPHLCLLVNNATNRFAPGAVQQQILQVYEHQEVAVLPHVDELLTLPSAGLFVVHYPKHPLSAALRRTALTLIQ